MDMEASISASLDAPAVQAQPFNSVQEMYFEDFLFRRHSEGFWGVCLDTGEHHVVLA